MTIFKNPNKMQNIQTQKRIYKMMNIDKILTIVKPHQKNDNDGSVSLLLKSSPANIWFTCTIPCADSLKCRIVPSINEHAPAIPNAVRTLEINTVDLEWLLLAAPKKDIRYYLNSIYWNGLNGDGTVVAVSDGHRVHSFGLTTHSDISGNFIIPREFAELCCKIAKLEKSDTVIFEFGEPKRVINYDQHQVWCRFKCGIMQSMTVGGIYPRITQIIPSWIDDNAKTISPTFTKKHLSNNFRDIAKIAGGFKGLLFKFMPDGCGHIILKSDGLRKLLGSGVEDKAVVVYNTDSTGPAAIVEMTYLMEAVGITSNTSNFECVSMGTDKEAIIFTAGFGRWRRMSIVMPRRL